MMLRLLFTLACLFGAAHCAGATDPPTNADAGDGGTSADSAAQKVPTVHRTAAAACTAPRPAGTPPGAPGDCKTDADCTAGKNGRCTYGPTFSAVCSYDECSADGDCGAGVCDCRNETRRGANTCFRGNCVTDADCGGGYCSPSGASLWDNCRSNVPAGSFGYFCHTKSDACVDDVDCGEGSTCLFSADTQRWSCLPRLCTK